MRIILELFALFFVVLTVYRRIIEPFLEGISGNRKPYNQQEAEPNVRTTAKNRKAVKPIDPNEIRDAEFEEIK